jgi:hypothetical protein
MEFEKFSRVPEELIKELVSFCNAHSDNDCASCQHRNGGRCVISKIIGIGFKAPSECQYCDHYILDLCDGYVCMERDNIPVKATFSCKKFTPRVD